MRKLSEVIRRPLITEKTTVARETSTVVVFEVALDATKIDVKRAVEKLLGAKVASVRTPAGARTKDTGRPFRCRIIRSPTRS